MNTFTPGDAITFKASRDDRETLSAIVHAIGTGTLTVMLPDGTKAGLAIDETVRKVEPTPDCGAQSPQDGQIHAQNAKSVKDTPEAGKAAKNGAEAQGDAMSEVITLTRDELNRKIAELRGYEYKAHATLLKETGEEFFFWFGPDGFLVGCVGSEHNLPQYLTDANAALELLEELPAPQVWSYTRGKWLCDADEFNVDSPIGEADTFQKAVALCYYEWKTGQRVTIESESQ